MPPPTNISAATATPITVLPTTITQRVDSGGTTYTVWYVYTAGTGVTEIGVFAPGDLAVYKPSLEVLLSDGVTDLLGGFFATNVPIQVPVTPGQTYYFKVNTNGGNPSPANLTFQIYPAPTLDAPVGSIMITDDSDGFPIVVLNAAGQVLQFVSVFIGSDQAAQLIANPNLQSYLALQDGTVVNLYDKHFNLVVSTTPPFTTPINYFLSSNKTSQYYVGSPGGGATPARVATLSPTGVYGTTIGPFAAAGLSGLAPSPDETILYYTGQSSSINAAVKRWSLTTNTALSDLVAGIATYETNDILVLSDGTLIVSYFHVGNPGTAVYKHYDATGATLNTYTMAGDTRLNPRIAVALDDPASFWSYRNLANSQGTYEHIRVSDGTLLSTASATTYTVGVYDGAPTLTPQNNFGSSSSCTILMVPIDIPSPNPVPPPLFGPPACPSTLGVGLSSTPVCPIPWTSENS